MRGDELNFFCSAILSLAPLNHMVFILQLVNVVYRTDWFVDTEPSLHPWDKFHLSMVNDPFSVLLASIC